MSREEVQDQVKEILVQPARHRRGATSRSEASLPDDLKADSLDLVELIMDLEERFGVKISDEEAQGIGTVGQAVDYVMATDSLVGVVAAMEDLRALDRGAPDGLRARRSPMPRGRRRAATPTSGWSSSATPCSGSRSPTSSRAATRTRTRAGSRRAQRRRLGRACAGVARALDLGAELRGAWRGGRGADASTVATTRSVLAGVTEAVIGAVFLAHGWQPARPGGRGGVRRGARRRRRRQARIRRPSCRSTCNVRAASLSTRSCSESGPPHRRHFKSPRIIDGVQVGSGIGAARARPPRGGRRGAALARPGSGRGRR